MSAHSQPTLAARFAADERGAATVEFVVIFTGLIYIFFMLGEVGVLMTRSVMLERGISIAMRDLRTGLIPDPDHDKVKARICEEAFLLTDCRDGLMLEMKPLADLAEAPPAAVRCVDRSQPLNPVSKFDPGQPSDVVFVRACVVVDPLFPGTGIGALLPKDATGAYAIVSESAFVNEPGA